MKEAVDKRGERERKRERENERKGEKKSENIRSVSGERETAPESRE